MQAAPKIPYAIGHFEKIVEESYYFIDKTRYIAELERYEVPVFLRPRRFGKTLWCSILECYYDINRKDRFFELFGNYDAGKQPTSLKNSFFVMRFNFSIVAVKPDIRYIERSFQTTCGAEIKKFCYVYREYFKDFTLNSELPISDQLSEICSYIGSRDLPPLYIIIDEYDNFTNQLVVTHNDALYYELTTGDSFFRTFFKVLKDGVEKQEIGKVFITGVLPITIDDLTSGFNIAEVITLDSSMQHMLGFTPQEVETYLRWVTEDYGVDPELFPALRALLEAYYNGYKFQPDDDIALYNSTILNFFLKRFVMEGNKLPRSFIDDNLRTDLNWIRRLSNNPDVTREMLETLMFTQELPYDQDMLASKFNMHQFFDKDFYPVSLFYLGMVTMKDEFSMRLPNQTMRKIFTEYFNAIEEIEVSKGYTGMFRQFLQDLDIQKLFGSYFDVYIGQLPAQVFDKVNENFYRSTFYELCTRYLSNHFTFSIEVNHPSGRTDLEILGKYHTKYKHQHFLIEFKFFSNVEAKKQRILTMNEPLQGDIEQVKRYERDILRKFPELSINSSLIYIAGNTGFNYFDVTVSSNPD